MLYDFLITLRDALFAVGIVVLVAVISKAMGA